MKKTPRRRAAAKAWRTIRRGPSKAQATALAWLSIAHNYLRVDETRFVSDGARSWRHARIEGIVTGNTRVPLVTLRVLEVKKWIARDSEPEVCGGSNGEDGMRETVATWTRWRITDKGKRALRTARGNGTI